MKGSGLFGQVTWFDKYKKKIIDKATKEFLEADGFYKNEINDNLLKEKEIKKIYNEKETLILNLSDFTMLGETAFQKNVHKKLRKKLSKTEKQMWINGYLLALNEQNKR